jgi:parvulin-like peptidyl-prolyl isomerase
MDEFEIVTFSMKEGEVSPVFATQHGFHLAKVTERKTGKPKAFRSVCTDIEAELATQRQEAKLQELVDELKKTAKINYIEPKEGLGDQNHE